MHKGIGKLGSFYTGFRTWFVISMSTPIWALGLDITAFYGEWEARIKLGEGVLTRLGG